MKERQEYEVKDGRFTIIEREKQAYILRGICERQLIHEEKFPLDVLELAYNLMPPDEYAAYMTLKEHDHVFSMKCVQYVNLPKTFTTFNKKASHTRAKGDNQLRLVKRESPRPHDSESRLFINAYEDGLPLTSYSEYYDTVMEWAETQWLREERALTAFGVINYMLLTLNTVGQVKRAAGDLLPFFSDRFQEAATKYTKKSALPPGFYDECPKKYIEFAIEHVSRNSLLPRTVAEEDYYRVTWRDQYSLPTAVRFQTYASDARRYIRFGS